MVEIFGAGAIFAVEFALGEGQTVFGKDCREDTNDLTSGLSDSLYLRGGNVGSGDDDFPVCLFETNETE